MSGSESSVRSVAVPITASARLIVTQPVKHGHDEEIRRWQAGVNRAVAVFPGFRDFELLRPAPGVEGSWTAIVRFDTEENLDAWLGSRERMELLKERPDPQFKLWRILVP